MPKALNIIKDEHRSLAAVLNGFRYLIGEIEGGRMQPDFRLLRAMLHYLGAFPEALHHPKEDEFLHPRLRARSDEAARMLEFVEEEHRQSRWQAQALVGLLDDYEREGAAAFPYFAEAVKTYAEANWRHIEREEQLVLPLAVRVLTPEDWDEIGKAFGAHHDPLGGIDVNKEFRHLFREIANLAPPPIGVGPARKE